MVRRLAFSVRAAWSLKERLDLVTLVLPARCLDEVMLCFVVKLLVFAGFDENMVGGLRGEDGEAVADRTRRTASTYTGQQITGTFALLLEG